MIRVHEGDLDWDDDNYPWLHGERFTGEVVETLPDGRLLSLSTYLDGRDHGPFKAWSGTGVLVVDGTSDRGLPVSQREWFDDGSPKAEREYDGQGILVRSRLWNSDGEVTEDYVKPADG